MANPEMTAQRHELRKRVLAALQEMPPQRRRCMTLFLEEVPIREIAEFLDLRPGTVKANLHEARKYLKERLGPDFADIVRELSDSYE
jgi:RNA polymerase sigma factor (sigma-70 family)